MKNVYLSNYKGSFHHWYNLGVIEIGFISNNAQTLRQKLPMFQVSELPPVIDEVVSAFMSNSV